MHHCHHHSNDLITLGILENFDQLAIILTMFITGLAGSFTHCIGMCGPIAASQMSLRLIGTHHYNISQKDRLRCALTIPYYLGKAFSYNILAAIPFFMAKRIEEIIWARWLIFLVLITTALLFLRAAFFKNFNFGNNNKINLVKYFQKLIARFAPNNYSWGKSTYGIRGLIQGIILGFIPCGFVYGSIVTAISYSDNALILFCSMSAFALATIPGLFISAYFGNIILTKFKNMFDILYSLTMALNSILLICYALKLI